MTDQSKLEKLFRQHYRQMYRLATMLLHDDAESKDVVHDIFAHLLRNSQDLREDTAESYLLTSVRNRCLNVIRSRKIQERVEHLYLLDLDTTITPLLAYRTNVLSCKRAFCTKNGLVSQRSRVSRYDILIQ